MSVRYSELSTRLREGAPRLARSVSDLSELEVQAAWFSGLFGADFRTVDGIPARIADFGRWNREAGPDFRDAAVIFDGAEPIAGDIELDRDARDWERHGHATNPDFRRVVLHIFLETGRERSFSRTADGKEVQQVRLMLEGAEEFTLSPPLLAHPGRCVAPLAGLEPGKVDEILASAARHRLQRKAGRLRRMMAAHGEDEALFQVTAEALGYRNNKLPMLLLAQRYPLAEARADGPSGEGVLFGLAGFLEQEQTDAMSRELLDELAKLWALWWKRRGQVAHLVLRHDQWRQAGRPLNHPHRRLAALFAIISDWPRYRSLVARGSLGELTDWLGNCPHPFWTRRYTLLSKPSEKELALVGPERCRDLFANVVMPWRFWTRGEAWSDETMIAGAAANTRVRTALIRLFGSEKAGAVHVKKLHQQQGLQQIYEDFCETDNSNCANCPFPELLQRW